MFAICSADTLKTPSRRYLEHAVSGLGGALMARGGGVAAQPAVPVGYDMPDYNPYAQPVAPQPLPQPVQPVPQPVQQPQQQMDGVFFEPVPATTSAL